MRILIVEDDPITSDLVRRALVQAGHSVDATGTGEEGEELASVNDYDVIILDLLLPGKGGRDVCRTLRAGEITTPILMLTGVDTIESRVEGLDCGADDYLVKPFHFEELLARVRSLGRRRSALKSSSIEVADMSVDIAHRTVTRAGVAVNLSGKEFALLEYFLLNRGKVITREMISEHVWDMNFDPQSNVIESLIRRLREGIDKGSSRPLIHTIRGVGYRFSEE